MQGSFLARAVTVAITVIAVRDFSYFKDLRINFRMMFVWIK